MDEYELQGNDVSYLFRFLYDLCVDPPHPRKYDGNSRDDKKTWAWQIWARDRRNVMAMALFMQISCFEKNSELEPRNLRQL